MGKIPVSCMDEVDVRTIQYAMEDAVCAAIDTMNEALLLPLLLHQLLLKIISTVGLSLIHISEPTRPERI